jgi:catechol 2,3-dioxygenase-like lactoylglutathione lyase family enzyme
MGRPLFQGVDCVMLRVSELEPALEFYCARLGHELVWRLPAAAGLKLPDATAELVLHTQQGPEVDLLVSDVEAAFSRFVGAGGVAIQPPFDIPIGRCAVVRDPFGNVLTMLDQSKGTFATDGLGSVTGMTPPT